VFPDLGRLDLAAAHDACTRAGVDAAGVIAVVDAAMEEAVRAVTVARGVDPRELALVAFGGAGPLHAVAVADALGMKAVIVPPRAGVLSAVGLLSSPRRREVVRSYPAAAGDPAVSGVAADVGAQARALVGDDADVEIAYDCRYVGQSHELTVASPADFPTEHERRNGHARPGAPVEVVAVRARATAAAPLDVTDLPAVARTKVGGASVVAEPDCTMWVPEGWVAAPRELGAWVLERTA
jgi:N-methylhydantoinase A/oxoprolinase/acetone carboxylase beta subunit